MTTSMPASGPKTVDRKTIRVAITGRVQGVWYRSWTIEQASARGLSGWVRNRRDGSVEALFSGPIAQVDAMVLACHTGPKAAQVDNVEVFEAEGLVAGGFKELPTA